MRLEWEQPNETPVPQQLERNGSNSIWREIEEFMHTETAEAREQPIHMTEGGFEANGRYIPGKVQEVDTEAAEFDPELRELKNELNTWIQQGERMSCAVASQTMAVNQLEHGHHTERELIDIGRKNHWYSRSGTCPEDVGKIAEHMGMHVEHRRCADVSELAMANDPEVKVLANVDSTLLQFPECAKRCQPDHCVQVLRMEHTEKGDFVILNDPGHEGGRGVVYPAEIFAKAHRGDITMITKEATA